jgi:mono/diheme cytochrome c family protein
MKSALASLSYAVSLVLLAGAAMPVVADAADAPTLYQQHCAACHGPGRLGLTGPALLPESLARLRKPEAIKVITEGRAATQMLGFADRLKKEEVAALADYIYTAVSPAPTFSEADIQASRLVNHAPGSLPAQAGRGVQGRGHDEPVHRG